MLLAASITLIVVLHKEYSLVSHPSALGRIICLNDAKKSEAS